MKAIAVVHRGLFWTALLGGGQLVVQLTCTAILARALGPDAFGSYTAALIAVTAVAMVGSVGLPQALVQKTACSSGEVESAALWLSVTGVVGALALTVLAGNIEAIVGVAGTAALLPWMAVSVPLRLLSNPCEAILQRQLSFRQLAAIELASYSLGYAVVGLASLLFCRTSVVLAIAHVAYTAVRALVVVSAIRPTPRIRVRRPPFHLFRFGLWHTVAQAANMLATEGDNLVVGRTMGAGALGLYGRAYQLVVSPAQVLVGFLDRVLFPTLSQFQHEKEELRRTYLYFTLATGFVVMPLAVIGRWSGGFVIGLLFGPQWLDAIRPFEILCAGLFFRAAFQLNDSLARSCGAVKGSGICQLLYVACVLIGAWLGSFFSVEGVALGVVVAMAVKFILTTRLAIRLVATTLTAYLRSLVPGLACASGVTLCIVATEEIARERFEPGTLVMIAVALLLGRWAFTTLTKAFNQLAQAESAGAIG